LIKNSEKILRAYKKKINNLYFLLFFCKVDNI